MRKCPECALPIDDHELADAWRCLEKIAAAAAELTARACGGAIVASLEMERYRRVPR